MNNNELINKLGLILQAISLDILFKDYNNTDLMQELQRQDTEYFDKVLKNQEKIIHLLEKGGTPDGEINRKD